MDVGSIKEAILKDGFVVIEASDVGQRVDDFTRKKYPFRAEGGLFFLKDTLSDSVSSLYSNHENPSDSQLDSGWYCRILI